MIGEIDYKMKSTWFDGPLDGLKWKITTSFIQGTKEDTPSADLTNLASSNATCLYIYDKKFGCSDEVFDWLLWEHKVLSPCVCQFVAAQKQPNSLKRATQELSSNLGYLTKHIEKTGHGTILKSAAQSQESVPSLVDIIVWVMLLPVSNFISSQQTFGVLKKWDAEFCAKYKVFQDAKSDFKLSNYETVLIREAERRVITDQNTSALSSTQKQSPVDKITPTPNIDIYSIGQQWLTSSDDDNDTIRPKRTAPILPEDNKRNVLITSALPYVNNIPHLGNIIGCVLSADVYSRYCRAMGYNSVYICGTDEYGTATETKALEEGVTPQQICDKYFAIHRDVYKWFNISFDYFGRTTTPYQTKIAQDIFWQLDKNGYLLEEAMDQLKCESCDRFLADRFVEGVCPHCGYNDARGDQCDSCAKLVDANKLKNPRCKLCSATPNLVTSNHLFLNLPLLEKELSEVLIDRMKSGVWSESACNITNAWLRDGLKSRCITRDLKWGTLVPKEPFTNKVFYVWFDAPIGYMSITANYCGDKWVKWWKQPQKVEMFNFMAKDNVPFHSVIFPSTLIGARDNYGLVDSLVATEYLNYEDGKFSKSRNVGVFGNNAQDSGIPADIFRFYLLFIRPESQDSTFSWLDFAIKSNAELLNNLGNFINRALSFCYNSFAAVVQPIEHLEDVDLELISNVDKELGSYLECMEKVKLRDALTKIMNVSRWANGYIQSTQPWVLNKSNEQTKKARAGAINTLCVNVVHLCALMLEPFMPATSFEIFNQLSLYSSADDQNGLPKLPKNFSHTVKSGHKINKPVPLFKKLEDAEILKLKSMYSGKDKSEKSATTTHSQGGKDLDQVLASASPDVIQNMISTQGDKVRQLKSTKPQDKEAISKEVELLKRLKAALEEQIKKQGANGQHNKAETNATVVASTDPVEIENMVTAQGDKVRQLKSAKPQNKEAITKEVEVLKKLKSALEEAKKQQNTNISSQDEVKPEVVSGIPDEAPKEQTKIIETSEKRGSIGTVNNCPKSSPPPPSSGDKSKKSADVVVTKSALDQDEKKEDQTALKVEIATAENVQNNSSSQGDQQPTIQSPQTPPKSCPQVHQTPPPLSSPGDARVSSSGGSTVTASGGGSKNKRKRHNKKK